MPEPERSWLDRLMGAPASVTPMDKMERVSGLVSATTPGWVDLVTKGVLVPRAMSALYAPPEPTSASVAQRQYTMAATQGAAEEPSPEEAEAAKQDFLRRFWEMKAEADRLGAVYAGRAQTPIQAQEKKGGK